MLFSCSLRRKWFSFGESSSRVLFGENRVHSVRALPVFLADKIACIRLELFLSCFRRKSFSFASSSSRVLFGENRVHSVRALLVFFSDKIASTRLELLGENRFHSHLLMFLSEKIVFIQLGRFSGSFRIKSPALA